MRQDFKHLKWKLINQEGLSIDEAQKRIDDLQEIMKINKKKKIGVRFDELKDIMKNKKKKVKG